MTTDQMPPHGEEIRTNIKCARCGDVVIPNEAHICKDKGETDENQSEKK